MSKNWFLSIFLLMFCNLFGQQIGYEKEIASLKAKLSKEKNDTAKVKILNELGYNYTFEKNIEEYSIYTKKAIAISEKIGYWEGIIEAYNVESNYYDAKGNTKKALETIQKMIVFANEKGDSRILGLAYLHLGEFAAYYPKENKDALKSFNRALELFKKSKDKNNIKYTLLNLGGYNLDIKNYNEALKNYDDYLKENPSESEKSNVYLGIGSIFSKQEKYKEAVKNLEMAVYYIEKSKRTNQIFYAHVVELLADNYVKVKEYKNALIAYNKAERYFEKESLLRLIALKAKKSNLYIKINDVSQAKKYLEDAIAVVDKLNNCTTKSISYTYIATEFENQKEYAKALTYLLKPETTCPEITQDKELDIELKTAIGYNYLMLAKNTDLINADYSFPKNKNKLLNLSLNYLDKALQKLSKTKNHFEKQKIYATISEAYELLGNDVKAYEAYKKHIVYKDSLATVENRELLVQNQMQFEFNQKEKLQKAEQNKKDALAREELANEKNNRNIAFGGIGFFILISGFSGYAYVQKRKDNKLISEEKQKSDDLLLNILPAEIAKELKEKGTSEAKHFDSVSIMFTDFKDFTKLSEKIPSTELIQELNYCFKEFDHIITKHGVEKIKTIGDSYMAVCGLPAKYGNHAQKMVDAALEIRDFIETYKEKRQQEGKSFFEMRIGINSGEVVAGIVGIKKFAYDIWGDAVNTASRMESNGVVGKVNISESTYKLVDKDFYFTQRGEIEVKGKGKINMYFVEPKEENR